VDPFKGPSEIHCAFYYMEAAEYIWSIYLYERERFTYQIVLNTHLTGEERIT